MNLVNFSIIFLVAVFWSNAAIFHFSYFLYRYSQHIRVPSLSIHSSWVCVSWVRWRVKRISKEIYWNSYNSILRQIDLLHSTRRCCSFIHSNSNFSQVRVASGQPLRTSAHSIIDYLISQEFLLNLLMLLLDAQSHSIINFQQPSTYHLPSAASRATYMRIFCNKFIPSWCWTSTVDFRNRIVCEFSPPFDFNLLIGFN